jgi:hypothetical protein
MSRTDNEKGNQNTIIYHSAWDPTISSAVKLSFLMNDPDTIILGADTEGTIIPFHSFTNVVVVCGQVVHKCINRGKISKIAFHRNQFK